MTPNAALIVIDMQNDFCDGGALAVPQASSIVPGINQLMNQFNTVVLSQDWHPSGHSSFASSHDGKSAYDTVEMPYGSQVLWPDHCIIGSQGAAFHKALNTDAAQLVVRKGFRPGIDSYSAFFENDRETTTGLHGYLGNREITQLTFVGLAYDFCVQYSAVDAAELGYDVAVIPDLCKAIDLNGSKDAATSLMKQANIRFA